MSHPLKMDAWIYSWQILKGVQENLRSCVHVVRSRTGQKKGNASRANVDRIQSGDCLPPAVDECLPVNHAKNNMDLKKYGHMRNMLYYAISVVWRWNLNFQ